MRETKGKNLTRLFIIGGALCCFAFIAYFVVTKETIGFDTTVREWFYQLRRSGLNGIMIAITYMGNWQAIVMLCLGLLVFNKTRKEIGVPLSMVSAVSVVIYKIIKSSFKRARPAVALHIINQGGYSFPSGHALNSLVVFGFLIYLIRKNVGNKRIANVLTGILSALIVLVGISRIYVGVHFPTDVLGGWFLGSAFLIIAIMVTEKIKTERGE
ncbi:MAG: phosphatase PAP2 family protein [Anaerovoracaceae bacterium]